MKDVFALSSLVCALSAGVAAAQDDAQSEKEVEARLETFNQAWIDRDLGFIRNFYAHDDDMLLFFERRQLRGFADVDTLYQNMFAHARPGSVRSSYSNITVGANGDMAYAAANFTLETENPSGDAMEDTGRVTVVLERRDGAWVAIHRHTSFQAPPGPQRKLPLHTDPGPLWTPTLEGVWRTEKGETLIASPTYVASENVSDFPQMATYRRAVEGLWVTPAAGGRARLVELARLTTNELILRLPGGSYTFQRVE